MTSRTEKSSSAATPDDYILVGARFARMQFDETALLANEIDSLEVSVEVQPPRVSDHKYGDRRVLEIGVSFSARAADSKDVPVPLAIECVAGFVGRNPEWDGDVARFEPAATLLSRAVYWMLRERLQSLGAVTVLRYAKDLPWDLVEIAAPNAPTTVGSAAKVPKRKKAAAK